MTNATPTPNVRRLERGDGPVGGVAAGLADYLDTDPTLIRLGLVLTTFVAGPVIPACYVAAWLIMPSSGDVPAVPQWGPVPNPPPPPPPSPAPTPPAPADPGAPAPSPSAAAPGSATETDVDAEPDTDPDVHPDVVDDDGSDPGSTA
jgi:phage shock protein PspC (stress-responsive transcriptional regulator)